ncbi:MAG: arylsulfatase [Bacteroidales bacterium]
MKLITMQNTNRLGLLFAGLTAFMPLMAKQQKKTMQKPNVLFILADDLGYGDLSCYGQEKFDTPNIDRLALNGMRFTQCYSGTTVSAPSRSALLTGMHTGHTFVRGNKEMKPEGQFPLPADTYTIFRLFRDAGYTTGAFGKWGLGGIGTSGDPNALGVDNFYGYNCQLLAHNYYPDHLWENDTRIELADNKDKGTGSYAQDLIHEKAIAFLESQNEEQPFFMYYPAVLPHAELIVPEDSIIRKFRGKYPETPFKGVDNGCRCGEYCSQVYPRATFAAMVYRLDVYVGQLIAKLKEQGLYDNTLIVFTSDNGPHQEGGADPVFFNGNGIYRGFKRDLYEGGIRVPMIVSWPGRISPGTETSFMCSFWDMMPTFREMIGAKTKNKEDGLSIYPLLTGTKGQKEHEYLYFEFQELGGRQALRRGDWKLLHLNIRNKPVYELYNIAADPQEKYNRIAEYPEIANDLKSLMSQARTSDSNWPLLPGE